VTREHDRIGSFVFCFPDGAANRLNRILKIDPSDKFRSKPKRHTRRRDSNDRDFNSCDLLHDIGLNFRERIFRIRNFASPSSFHQRIRGQHRHRRFFNGMQKRFDAPVKLVVANDPSVVFQMIEQVDHQLTLGAQANIGALINITHVDQDRVWILLAPIPDLRHATRQTAEVRIPVVIGRGQNVPMQISRVQDRDGDGVGIEGRSRTRHTWNGAD
jgi:hypothetical protein